MVRVYRETFSKGNQCFLRAETTMSSRSVLSEYHIRLKLDNENDITCTILCEEEDNCNLMVIREADNDFITITTISDLEAK